MEYEGNEEEDKELTNIIELHSPNFKDTFDFLEFKEQIREQQLNSDDLNCDQTVKFFSAEYVE